MSEAPKPQTSVDLAYQISIDSYKNGITRFDALDNKIQNLFTFALGFLVIAPTLIKPSATSLNRWFWFAIGLLVIAAILSVIARLHGKLNQLSPQVILDKKFLELDGEAFKKKVIESAGEAFVENRDLLERKWRLSLASMITFAGALVCLVYWLARQVAST